MDGIPSSHSIVQRFSVAQFQKSFDRLVRTEETWINEVIS